MALGTLMLKPEPQHACVRGASRQRGCQRRRHTYDRTPSSPPCPARSRRPRRPVGGPHLRHGRAPHVRGGWRAATARAGPRALRRGAAHQCARPRLHRRPDLQHRHRHQPRHQPGPGHDPPGRRTPRPPAQPALLRAGQCPRARLLARRPAPRRDRRHHQLRRPDRHGHEPRPAHILRRARAPRGLHLTRRTPTLGRRAWAGLRRGP
jgi:hypothetical protein